MKMPIKKSKLNEDAHDLVLVRNSQLNEGLHKEKILNPPYSIPRYTDIIGFQNVIYCE